MGLLFKFFYWLEKITLRRFFPLKQKAIHGVIFTTTLKWTSLISQAFLKEHLLICFLHWASSSCLRNVRQLTKLELTGYKISPVRDLRFHSSLVDGHLRCFSRLARKSVGTARWPSSLEMLIEPSLHHWSPIGRAPTHSTVKTNTWCLH